MKTPSSNHSVLITDRFFSQAKSMRQEFENRFADPRNAKAERFVWDYWHIENQYTALRTPAYLFFKRRLYEAFHNQLVWWGRRNLGCHDVSPPWMSCYIEGCKQELHGDLPHGPWAFVYSLTPWKERVFQGGETMLLREPILNLWKDWPIAKHKRGGMERADIVEDIPSLFNRLLVFDPRIPHGVREVRGVHDVCRGRLVIHGWFVQPRPFIEGPLKPEEMAVAIEDLFGLVQTLISEGLDVQGILSARFRIANSGLVDQFEVLSHTLRGPAYDARARRELERQVRRFFEKYRFTKMRQSTSVTLPLVFER